MQSESLYEEETLLSQLAMGSEPAFRQVYDQYKQRIYSFAFFLTRSEMLAEDLTQEIFVKVWTHRASLTEINFFNSWLKTLVRNLAYTWLQRMVHEKLILQEISRQTAEASAQTETELLNNEYDRLLQEAINRLPPQQKKVYLLSRRDGLRQEAIAEEMGISVNTVKNHMKAALQSIRLFLEARTDLLVITAMTLFF